MKSSLTQSWLVWIGGISDSLERCQKFQEVGWLFFDHGKTEAEKDMGSCLIDRAIILAIESSLKDEFEKIRAEHVRRGIDFYYG